MHRLSLNLTVLDVALFTPTINPLNTSQYLQYCLPPDAVKCSLEIHMLYHCCGVGLFTISFTNDIIAM